MIHWEEFIKIQFSFLLWRVGDFFFGGRRPAGVRSESLTKFTFAAPPPPFFSGFLQLQLKEAVIIHLIEVWSRDAVLLSCLKHFDLSRVDWKKNLLLVLLIVFFHRLRKLENNGKGYWRRHFFYWSRSFLFVTYGYRSRWTHQRVAKQEKWSAPSAEFSDSVGSVRTVEVPECING